MRTKVVGCLILIMGTSPILSAAEQASWGEVKNSLTRPAGKIAHHEDSRIVEVGDEEFRALLLGLWESRRFNEANQLETVQYLFEEEGDQAVVTLLRTNTTTGESSEPITGTWQLEPDIGITFTWVVDTLSLNRGLPPSDWVDVKLYISDDSDLLVLDYNSSVDKELRTLNQDRSTWTVGPVRNWIILLDPEATSPEGTLSVGSGQWIREDFKVLAADGHLPEYLRFRVEGSRSQQVHILSIPAYYGSEEVPHVNLCGPVTGHRWESSRELRLSLDNNDGAGIFITGCGAARATINIYAPEATPQADEPLASFGVRTGG